MIDPSILHDLQTIKVPKMPNDNFRLADWYIRISQEFTKAKLDNRPNGNKTNLEQMDVLRRHYINIAAFAIAAAESVERSIQDYRVLETIFELMSTEDLLNKIKIAMDERKPPPIVVGER